MIYEGAARIKTPADNAMSFAFEQLLAASDFTKVISRGESMAMTGLSDVQADEAFARVSAAFENVRKMAVDRTVDAVESENKMIEQEATKTNGQRRGGEPPSPPRPAINSASRKQYNDVLNLVREEVFSREARRAWGDRWRERTRRS
jgi:hypothetical protein